MCVIVLYVLFLQAKPKLLGIPYKNIKIGVPKETFQNERRVGLVPATVATLTKKGFNVSVEDGAGDLAKFTNADYEAAGGSIAKVDDIYKSDMVLKVRPPTLDEVAKFSGGNTLISMVYPAQNKELVEALAAKKMTVYGMECVPRISRAQVCYLDQ